MADTILDTAEKLAKLALKAADSLGELKKKVDDLTYELKTIASLVKKSNVMTDNEEHFDRRVIQQRQLAFKAEDVVEVFINNSTPCEGCNIFQLIMGCSCQIITLHKLKNEIDGINSELKKLQVSGDQSNLLTGAEDTGEASIFDHRVVDNQMALGTGNEDDGLDHMVGFEDVAREVLSSLTKEDELGELRAVSIVAQAGAGKTAVARDIYKRCCVNSHFNCVARVSVSPKYNVQDIWQSILKQVKEHTREENNEHGVATTTSTAAALHHALQEKDYLIILDDLWKKEDWKKISKAFPKSPEKKCRVLITTRNNEVAHSANQLMKPFELRLLKPEESLELFLRKVFGCSPIDIPHNILSQAMKSVAGQLVSECDNLPIAIVLLGGLLSEREKNVDEWVEMHKRVRSVLKKSRVFRMAFALSYNDLTYTAKSCFLYLGHFPEDSLIDCDKLIRLWAAEGFLGEEDDMEDNGRDWLKYLIRKSMIQVVETRLNGAARTCGIHDLVRKTTEEEAKKAMFSSVFKKKQLESVEAGIRRIAVHPNEGIDEFLHTEGKSSSTPLQSSSLTTSSARLQSSSVTTSSAPLQSSSLTTSSFKPSVAEANDIVDFEKEADQLVSLLMNEKPLGQLDVVSISGMAGIGKTTLARKVYNRIVVGSYFATCAWVTVSPRFSPVDILKAILKQVTELVDAESKLDDEYELQKMLHHHLKEKRSYLIVFDDIWRQEDWDILERLLPIQSQQNCRVLLTTRLYTLALYASRSEALVLQLQLHIRRVLDATVEDLPNNLKYCLACCSLFLEDTEIQCDKLTRLWVAKGFLEARDNKTIEDVARDCLEELVRRSLIQVTERRLTGAPETCRIHDLILDFCVIYAREIKLPFSLESTDLELVEGNDPTPFHLEEEEEEATSTPQFQPRKSFNLTNSLLPVLNLFNFPNHVHSLMCFSKNPQIRFEAFPLLRVLDLQGAENIDQLPNEIGNLTLLRYLGLRGTRVRQIPPWISNLLNLQTLDAPGSKVPLDIWKLNQLRHLFAHSFFAPENTCFPYSSSSSSSQSFCIGVLEQLQTLEVDFGDWEIRDLHRCTKLRVLRLRLHGAAHTLRNVIGFMKCLKFINLTKAGESSSSMSLPSLSNHQDLSEIVVEGTVTEATDFPPYLTYLWLEVSVKKQVDPFSRFQKLSCLKKLCLRLFKDKSSADAVQMTCPNGGFLTLEFLYITVDFKLENWIVEKGALPSLKVLHVEGEGNLPYGLEHVRTLKELVITRGCHVPQSLNDGREERDKVTIKYLNKSSMRP